MHSHITPIFCAVALLCGNAAAATIDFDGLAPGSTVTTIDGVTFGSNTGLDLIVSTGLETTSGANYLGVDDGFSESFLPGDEINFDFDMAITSLSITAVTTAFFAG